jgi:hypothetical protein
VQLVIYVNRWHCGAYFAVVYTKIVRLRFYPRSLSTHVQASPDLQTKHGYELDPPNEANLALASNQVGQRFDCLSFTFEMPFKDTIDDPNPVTGWSPERCQRLGAAMLTAVEVVLPMLRSPVL